MLKRAAASHSAHGHLRPSSWRSSVARSAQPRFFLTGGSRPSYRFSAQPNGMRERGRLAGRNLGRQRAFGPASKPALAQSGSKEPWPLDHIRRSSFDLG